MIFLIRILNSKKIYSETYLYKEEDSLQRWTLGYNKVNFISLESTTVEPPRVSSIELGYRIDKNPDFLVGGGMKRQFKLNACAIKFLNIRNFNSIQVTLTFYNEFWNPIETWIIEYDSMPASAIQYQNTMQ